MSFFFLLFLFLPIYTFTEIETNECIERSIVLYCFFFLRTHFNKNYLSINFCYYYYYLNLLTSVSLDARACLRTTDERGRRMMKGKFFALSYAYALILTGILQLGRTVISFRREVESTHYYTSNINVDFMSASNKSLVSSKQTALEASSSPTTRLFFVFFYYIFSSSFSSSFPSSSAFFFLFLFFTFFSVS